MKNVVSIHLNDIKGAPLGVLRSSASDIFSEADDLALNNNLSKRSALAEVVRNHVVSAGFQAERVSLEEAIKCLNDLRRGGQISAIEITVEPGSGDMPVQPPAPAARRNSHGRMKGMTPHQEIFAANYFEAERTYPDKESKDLYERLVGLDDQKSSLLTELEIILYPDLVERWSRDNHGSVLKVCQMLKTRPALLLLEGDVGCGKTALAETVGDALARRIGGDTTVHLLKVNTQVRGSGHVGEMSDLIVQAFSHAEARARNLDGAPLLLLIDEADALASTRQEQHMHHEDKAGLNTLLQRIDNLRLSKLRMAVIFVTNRMNALDPAIRRRAAIQVSFKRPDDKVRSEIIQTCLPELVIGQEDLRKLVKLTGPREVKKSNMSYTASDITDRLIPAAVRDAYRQKRPLEIGDLLSHAATIEPTPHIGELP